MVYPEQRKQPSTTEANRAPVIPGPDITKKQPRSQLDRTKEYSSSSIPQE
uniref:Uncharacterized protein n=1 Tax=Arundo donax TaxID=35708 RepID=A0A0A8ZSW9_ARUDO